MPAVRLLVRALPDRELFDAFMVIVPSYEVDVGQCPDPALRPAPSTA
jgi:hypothetical protein